jgi:hypothetical protein
MVFRGCGPRKGVFCEFSPGPSQSGGAARPLLTLPDAHTMDFDELAVELVTLDEENLSEDVRITSGRGALAGVHANRRRSSSNARLRSSTPMRRRA